MPKGSTTWSLVRVVVPPIWCAVWCSMFVVRIPCISKTSSASVADHGRLSMLIFLPSPSFAFEHRRFLFLAYEAARSLSTLFLVLFSWPPFMLFRTSSVPMKPFSMVLPLRPRNTSTMFNAHNVLKSRRASFIIANELTPETSAC